MASRDILKYLPLAVLPIISATMWLAMLLALIIYWGTHGHSKLPSLEREQQIPYVSDIGAMPKLQPLFIAGAVVTTVFLDLALLSERWLRHKGRLAGNLSRGGKVFSWLAIFFAIIGTLGLILLSCYDTLHYRYRHDGFLSFFMTGYILSAICICAEYFLLARHFRRHRILRNSFLLKLWFILIEVMLAIVFGICTALGRDNVAAVFEWIIAFIFTFWVLSFVLDLLPAAGEEQVKGNEMVFREPVHRSEYVGDVGVANVGAPMTNGMHADGAVNGHPNANSGV